MKKLSIFIVGSFIAISFPGNAAVYKCTNDLGKVEFTDKPCTLGALQQGQKDTGEASKKNSSISPSNKSSNSSTKTSVTFSPEQQEAFEKAAEEVGRGFSDLQNYCVDYTVSLKTCRPYSCEYPHPFFLREKFMATKEIIGAQGVNCLTTETMPGDQVLNCSLPPDCIEATIEVTDKFLKTGSFNSGDTSSEKSQKCMNSYCQVASNTAYNNQQEIGSRLDSQAVQKVFAIPIYHGKLNLGDGVTQSELFFKQGDTFVKIESPYTDQFLPEFKNNIHQSFKISSNGDAKIFEEALDAVFPLSSFDTGIKSFKQSGNQWSFIRGKFFEKFKGFIVKTDSSGSIVEIEYSLQLAQ